MQIIRGIQQGSDEWHELRRGVLTASNAQAIVNNGKGLETYINELMQDYYRKVPKEHFMSVDMQRGIDLEPDARFCYEIETGYEVEQVTFCRLNEHVGCSPDGLIIGQPRGVEIKCPKYENHFAIVLDRTNIPSYWIQQIQFSLYVTGYKTWDFVSYNPDCEKHFITYPFEPDIEMFERIEKGIKSGIKQKLEIIEKIEKQKINRSLNEITGDFN